MPTHATSNGHRGLGAAVKAVSERASKLVRLELELAALELKQKLSALGVGIGLGPARPSSPCSRSASSSRRSPPALATFLATWLALLIVTLFLFVLVAVLGLLGVGSIKKGTPPVPQQAIREAKLTTTAIRSE